MYLFNNRTLSPLSANYSAIVVVIDTHSMSLKPFGVSNISFSIAILNLSTNKLILWKFAFANTSTRKSKLSRTLLLIVLIDHAFIVISIIINYLYLSNWLIFIPNSYYSAAIGKITSFSIFLSAFEWSNKLLSWRINKNAWTMTFPFKPLSFIDSTI